MIPDPGGIISTAGCFQDPSRATPSNPAVLMIPDPGGISCPHCEAESDVGSAMYTGILLPAEFLRVMKILFGSSSSLKSPWRIESVGTVRLLVSVKMYLTHSSPQYQKTLVLSVLKWLGM